MGAIDGARMLCTLLVAGALVLAAPAQARADCPVSHLQVGDFFSDLPGPSGEFHSQDGYGTGAAWFVGWGDSLGFDIDPVPTLASHGNVRARGSFQLLGRSAGTIVPLQLEMHVTVDMQTAQAGSCDTQESATLLVDGAVVAERAWYGEGDEFVCGLKLKETLVATVNVTAGQWFTIEQFASCFSEYAHHGTLSLRASLSFRDLPPGAFVVACDGSTAAGVAGVGPSAPSTLSVDAVWPNPSRAEIHASCALPRGGPAVLRLLDAAGRLVETRIWDAPEATRREVTLGGRLAPGAYFLQVSQGARSATRAVTIVR